MGSFTENDKWRVELIVVGKDVIAEFYTVSSFESYNEQIKAFLSELQNKRWKDPTALREDFLHIEFNEISNVKFLLAENKVVIEGTINFDNGILLIKKCSEAVEQNKNIQTHTDGGQAA